MKQITKTLLASALSLGMVFSLVACGSSDEKVSEEPTVSETETETEKVTEITSSEVPTETETTKTEPVNTFDPFEGITIKCSGADGNISVEFDFSNSYYDESAYTIEGATAGLYDGDAVTITVSDLALAQTEESDGLIPSQTSKTFRATADGKFITNANDISDEFIEEYSEYFRNKIFEDYSDEFTQILSVEYIGYYFGVNEKVSKKNTYTEHQNDITFVYNVTYNYLAYTDKNGNETWETVTDIWREGCTDLSINNGIITFEDEHGFSINTMKENGYVILANTVPDDYET